MNDLFQKRVRAAAVATWWVVLIAFVVLWIQWIVYRCVMASPSPWILSWWGPNITWEFMQTTWLYAILIFKMIAAILALLAIWLSLWARQLRKIGV